MGRDFSPPMGAHWLKTREFSMSPIFMRLLMALLSAAYVLATPALAQENNTEPEVSASVFVLKTQEPDIALGNLEIFMVPLMESELSQVAEAWQKNLRTELERIAELNVSISQAAVGDADKLRQNLTARTLTLTELQAKYEAVLKAWEIKGAPVEELAVHATYLVGLRAGTIQNNDPVTLLRAAGNWLISPDGGLGIVKKTAFLILGIWAMSYVAKFVCRLAGNGLAKVPNLSRLLKSFVLTAVYWVTFAVGVMVVLAMSGVNIGPVFALFGGLSFVLAFALQDTLGNLASGLMIMILKPFDTDDFIHTAGTSGVVVAMSMVSTKVRTFDNQIIVIPNSKIWGDVITNVNASDTRRVDIVFGIAYSDSAEHAIAVLTKLAQEHDLILDDPEPEIFVGELGDSSVNIFCRPWVKSEDYWTVYWGMLGLAKTQFDAEGISIPFPQRDVHLHQVQPQEIE